MSPPSRSYSAAATEGSRFSPQRPSCLTIRGKKKFEKEEKEKTYLRVERAEGAFSRTLEMPTDVDQQDVRATYKKGVLKLVLKKTTPQDSRKIEIKTS